MDRSTPTRARLSCLTFSASTAGRTLCLALAALAISWTVAVWPSLRANSRLESVAKSILDGERFTNAQMQSLTSELSSPAPSGRIRMTEAAVLRLRIVEDRIAVGSGRPDNQELADASDAVTSALSQNPSDSFLWLAKFRLQNLAGDATDRAQTFLRMSYRLGPNEGWIAIHRNAVALEAFSKLSPQLAERVILEFVELVRSGFYSDAAKIFAGPGWPVREKLLPRIGELKEEDRRKLSRELESRGIDGALVPGVAQSRTRPF